MDQQDSKYLITKKGFDALLDEYNRLKTIERVEVTKTIEWARSNGDLSENGDYLYAKRRLREIDERLAYLASRLSRYEVVDPASIESDAIQFGATVKLLDLQTDKEIIYTIVGEDEIEPDKGLISYKSPIGRALLGKKVGDFVEVVTPKGSREFEILEIFYQSQI